MRKIRNKKYILEKKRIVSIMIQFMSDSFFRRSPKFIIPSIFKNNNPSDPIWQSSYALEIVISKR